ncbi:hypothetical protein YC2023_058383 [Brassica napus]
MAVDNEISVNVAMLLVFSFCHGLRFYKEDTINRGSEAYIITCVLPSSLKLKKAMLLA